VQLDRDGGHYCRHVSAMTREGLHAKSDIAAELAWRDSEIDRLRLELVRARTRVFALAHAPGAADEVRDRLREIGNALLVPIKGATDAAPLAPPSRCAAEVPDSLNGPRKCMRKAADGDTLCARHRATAEQTGYMPARTVGMSLEVALDFADNPRPHHSLAAPADTNGELYVALKRLAEAYRSKSERQA